jgi:hypothetical protein
VAGRREGRRSSEGRVTAPTAPCLLAALLCVVDFGVNEEGLLQLELVVNVNGPAPPNTGQVTGTAVCHGGAGQLAELAGIVIRPMKSHDGGGVPVPRDGRWQPGPRLLLLQILARTGPAAAAAAAASQLPDAAARCHISNVPNPRPGVQPKGGARMDDVTHERLFVETGAGGVGPHCCHPRLLQQGLVKGVRSVRLPKECGL